MHRIGLGIIFIMLFLAGGFFGLYGVSFAVDGIVPGVRVGPVEMGGLSRSDASRILDEYAHRLEKTPVYISHGDNTWHAAAGDLGIGFDVEKTLDEVCRAGNTGSVFSRFSKRQRIKHQGMHIEPHLTLDRRQLESKVLNEMSDIIAEPSNAGFKILPDDRVIVVSGRKGTKVDYKVLEQQITRGIITSTSNRLEVNLPVRVVDPRRSAGDIESMEISGLIGQYSTRFDAGQAGRTYNIKVAAAALDGQLISPGDEFSFNRIVGPRSSDAGYKSADVIINNEFVEGLGGGVCQVSSTLYNAVLLANLRITERNNHSLPVGYVPIGRDATVVYEAVDFRFANNTDFYVYIKTCVTGNDLTVKLYGNKDKTPRVEVSSWVTETIQPHVVYEKDPNLAAGEKVVKQEGNDGFKAAAVRNIWQNGRKVTETLPASHYHPVRRIVAIGTGASKPAVVFPQDQDLTPSVDLPGTTFVDQPVAPDTGPQDETETGGDTAKNDIDNGAAIGTESDPGVAAGDGYFENTAETGEQNGNDAPPPGDAGAQAQPE